MVNLGNNRRHFIFTHRVPVMSSSWLPLEIAIAQAFDLASPVTESETVSLDCAVGRICANEITSPVNVPPWDNSAMDGYVLPDSHHSQGDTLAIAGKVFAGDPIPDDVINGHSLRIMTGAPVPKNAYAVTMQENTQADEHSVTLTKSITQGDNIRLKGSDISQGDVVIAQGTRITAAHIMLLASIGIAELPVYRKVTVGVLATGDELVAPGQTCGDGQIFESNRSGLKALIQALNVDIVDFGIVKDDLSTITDTLQQASERCDLVVSSGGVSVGEADFVKAALAKLGQVDFWKVAIKPGKPFACGRIGNALFTGVPGNPVSAYVTTEQIVMPVLRYLQGETGPQVQQHLSVPAILTHHIKRRAGRKEFLRAQWHLDQENQLRVTPLNKQSSGVMTSVAQANCYLVLDADVSEIHAGNPVVIQPFQR